MRITTVARHGSKMANVSPNLSFPIWTGAVYEAKRNKKGVTTWRRVGSFGGTRSGDNPSNRFVGELMDAAEYPWVFGVRHGQPVRPRTDIPVSLSIGE